MTKTIGWVLGSRHQGNQQQLTALAQHYCGAGNVRILHCNLRSNNLPMRVVYTLFIQIICRLGNQHAISVCLKKLALNIDTPLSEIGSNDWVFAKTPRFSLPLALLVAGSRRQAVFMGEPRKLPKCARPWLIATPSTPVSGADSFLEVLPGGISYQTFCHNRQPPTNSESRIWTLLIGGEANGYHYTNDDWQQLIKGLSYLAKTHHIRWLVTTSPRTGHKVETLLQQALQDQEYIARLVCWGQGERLSILECARAASCLLVFEDSVSMLSEGITTRLPLFALHPSKPPAYNSLVTPFVDYHAERQHLLRLGIDQLQTHDVRYWATHDFTPISQCWTEQLKSPQPL